MKMEISFPGGSRVDAVFDRFRVTTDQSVDHGGGGTAPAPFDLFLASLGTCAGFYVLKFLEQRGLSTRDVLLALDTTRDADSRMIREVRLSVRLPAGFPAKYEKAIVHAVNLCAVKKHLENPPSFRTEVVIGEDAARDHPAEVHPA